MKNRLKRYGMAVVFLTLVIALMLLATLGVKDFGDKISKDVNITITPQGERIKL